MIATASKTIEAAGNYAAADILSENDTNGQGTAWDFGPLNLLDANGVITYALLTCSEDSITTRFRLHLFKNNPSNSELDDNAAKNFAAADRVEEIGVIDFPAPIDKGAYSETDTSCYVGWRQDAQHDNLYGVLEALDAETNETAGMTISISLFLEESRG